MSMDISYTIGKAYFLIYQVPVKAKEKRGQRSPNAIKTNIDIKHPISCGHLKMCKHIS
jgi:hypothetical protein